MGRMGIILPIIPIFPMRITRGHLFHAHAVSGMQDVINPARSASHRVAIGESGGKCRRHFIHVARHRHFSGDLSFVRWIPTRFTEKLVDVDSGISFG